MNKNSRIRIYYVLIKVTHFYGISDAECTILHILLELEL